MHKFKPVLALVFILATGVVAAPTLYAQGNQAPTGPSGGQGMTRDGMMGQGGMMQQMTQMMESCNKMMSSRNSGGQQQNDQKPAPSEPEKKG